MKTLSRLTVILLLTLILSSWQVKTTSQAASTLGLSAIPTAFTPNSYDIYDGALGDVDNDGDLDLAVAINDLPPSPPYVDGRVYIYFNVDGVLQENPGWASSNTGAYRSLGWGDVDNDGDLDLAVSSPYNPVRVFKNNAGVLGGGAWWSSNANNGGDVAWGDIDNDGDLDLAVGMSAYFNTGGNLDPAPGWTPAAGADCYEIALGDLNGDGLLDLATANRGGKSFIFFNTGSTFETNHSWESTDTGAWSVALADINGDGRLDMALGDGDISASFRVFFNSASGLETTPSWSKTGLGRVGALSWGDVDNDGDLDLAGSSSYRYIFLNDGGALQAEPAWTSSDEATSNAIPWGDLDNDGDLEMVSANSGSPSKVYFNSAPFLANSAAWTASASSASSVAWGDVDGDSDLDLAVSGMHQNRLHLNQGGQLNSSPVWTSPEDTNARAAAWADVDGDGDLDLAIANSLWWSGSYWFGDGRNRIYYNTGSGLTSASPWVSADSVPHTCLAWGDVDGDGDLDLASGVDGFGDVLYLNNNGALNTSPSWYSNNIGMTQGLAWGDVDNDGDLDLAIVSYGTPNKLYRNNNGVLSSTPVWQANASEGSHGVAWADVDGDSDLDLVVGNFWGFSKIYKNTSGTLEVNASWQNLHNDGVRGIALGDVNGDGFPDLATAASNNDPKRLYMNQKGLMDMLEIWTAPEIIQSFGVAWGDMNRDGILDLAASGYSGGNSMVYLGMRPAAAPAPTSPTAVVIDPYSSPAPTFNLPSPALAPANYYAVPAIRSSDVITFTYNLFDPTGLPFRQVRAFYSQDGGGSWEPALPSAATQLTNLASTEYPTMTVGSTHVFGWDVYASGFFGLSDNVIFRLEALPPLTTPSGQATQLFQMPLVSTQTFPFRVRGTQVRVFQEGDPLDTPVPGALVYRIPSGLASGGTINDPTGQPYQTDQNGYLKGRGRLDPGDQLVALLPVEVHDQYTLYYTSAAPIETGLQGTPVEQPGVQELTVSKENPLALINLKLSLEWDARNDSLYLQRLEYDLQRTSQLLFDWSDGQAALGTVTIYQAREHWNDADVRIYATNRMRPNANRGGIVSGITPDPLVAGMFYYPGQVRIGAEWNRYGDPGSSLSEDWPRTLAHELGHYLFYLDDNYLGFNEQGLLVPVEGCTGVMSDPYREDYPYDEFHLLDEWIPACQNTLSNQLTGRADWQTISAFYTLPGGGAIEPQLNLGPSSLPIDVTQVQVIAPAAPDTTLPEPIYYLTQDNQYIATGASARALLMRGDWLTDLGQPVLGRLRARGASVGDRLCVFEPAEQRLGCELVAENDQLLALSALPGWQPDITITPVTTRTIQVDVSHLPSGLVLYGRLFPYNAAAAAAQTLDWDGDSYLRQFTTAAPALAGYVQIWVDEPAPRREAVTDYTMGGNPANIDAHEGAPMLSRFAPALSSDGQVILFGDLSFEEDEFYSLQVATLSPEPPLWATPVGHSYRLLGTPDAPDLSRASLSFDYIGSQVPDGEETWLKIFYYDEALTVWQPLTTTLDLARNSASAPAHQTGLYALMSSLDIPLESAGWNLISYPVQDTRPITEALASIEDYYTTVYGYESTDPDNPWRVYDVDVPEWVNDLFTLEFAHSYWINMTEAITWYLKGAQPSSSPSASPPSLPTGFVPLPPATYYGALQASPGLTPAVGMQVQAVYNGRVCGQALTQEVDGQIVYLLKVSGLLPDGTFCVPPGEHLLLFIDGRLVIPYPVWENHRPIELNLNSPIQIIIPVLFKSWEAP